MANRNAPGIAQFRFRMPDRQDPRIAVTAHRMGRKTVCDFYTAEDFEKNGSKAFAYAWKRASQVENNKQLCACVASMMSLVCPNIQSSIVTWCLDQGIELRERKVPEDTDHLMEVLEDVDLDYPHMHLVFGCCCLLIFKNIAEVSYEKYMTARVKALISLVGADPKAKMGLPFTLKQAEAIRIMIGSSVMIKEAIIRWAIGTSRDNAYIGQLAQYLCGIFAWSEMNALVFIYETLLLTKSPVLGDPRVQAEVRNLREAFYAMSCRQGIKPMNLFDL